MSLLVLTLALALVAVPRVLHRFGLRLGPAQWVRLCAGSLAVGTILIHLALASIALPTVLIAIDSEKLSASMNVLADHVAPGGWLVGWAAVGIGTVQFALIVHRIRHVRRVRGRVHVPPGIGHRRSLGQFELVVLPADEVLALGSPALGQVIVSEELFRCLGPEEASAVLRHEAAHLHYRHHRYLWIAAVADAALPNVVSRHTTGQLRAAIERWADEAAGTTKRERMVLRRAIELVCARMRGPSPDLHDRMVALDAGPLVARPWARVLAVVPALVLVASAAAMLGDWAGHVQGALAAANQWPIP